LVKKERGGESNGADLTPLPERGEYAGAQKEESGGNPSSVFLATNVSAQKKKKEKGGKEAKSRQVAWTG